ncbi:MAG: EAL domain-containing protein [Oscillospiraceae bacterium]|nr:EAL domain-containing protein [Oscillospiraceae bacterium]MBQ7130585.1 EAL domain-containing protein [Oscillospiraceae bacterium]
MAVKEQTWKRKEYETWDEAFRGLTPAVRQQSVRVAAYTQTLFVQACASSFGTATREGADRMQGQYADLAYKCGMYHQLGKALVPPEYQIWMPDFTEEEQAVYKKYTTDGRLLVAALQDRSIRAREKRRGELVETPTRNVPNLMIRESCEQHMERWDGTGYPEGRQGSKISPIAQIVGIAKELDRIASETKSENPFDDAYQALVAQSGKAWDPALIEVLKTARPKCRAIYNKYIHYTMTLPKTIPLVEKRKERPMGLSYRPMVSNMEGAVVAYEAVPWFGGILGRPGETETMAELEPMLVRKQLVEDMSFYFLYEAADAVLRIENCKLDLKAVVLHMMPSFYQLNTQLQRFNQLFKDQPIPREKLLLTITEETLLGLNKAKTELVERYLRNGIRLVLDGYHPDKIPADKLKAMGFTYLRLAPELYMSQETANTMNLLRRDGFTLLGGGADTHDIVGWLAACGVSFMSGTITGVPVSENELIRDSLAREKA